MAGHVLDRLVRTVVAGVLALGSVSAPADPGASPDGVTIVVFADRYVVGDRAFDDLNALEKHITATHFRGVKILVCGAKATRALKAVVHRFRQVPVQIRVPDADEPECFSKAAGVMPVRGGTGPRPFGIDDEAVERYWRDLMP
jgi:hypothetical protein